MGQDIRPLLAGLIRSVESETGKLPRLIARATSLLVLSIGACTLRLTPDAWI